MDANVSEREVQLVAVLRYYFLQDRASWLLHGMQVDAPNSATVGFPLAQRLVQWSRAHPVTVVACHAFEQATDSTSDATRQTRRMRLMPAFVLVIETTLLPSRPTGRPSPLWWMRPQFAPPLPRCCQSTPALASSVIPYWLKRFLCSATSRSVRCTCRRTLRPVPRAWALCSCRHRSSPDEPGQRRLATGQCLLQFVEWNCPSWRCPWSKPSTASESARRQPDTAGVLLSTPSAALFGHDAPIRPNLHGPHDLASSVRISLQDASRRYHERLQLKTLSRSRTGLQVPPWLGPFLAGTSLLRLSGK